MLSSIEDTFFLLLQRLAAATSWNKVLLSWAVVVVQWVERSLEVDARDPPFDPRHQQNFINQFIYQCIIEKTKIKKMRPGMAHL